MTDETQTTQAQQKKKAAPKRDPGMSRKDCKEKGLDPAVYGHKPFSKSELAAD